MLLVYTKKIPLAINCQLLFRRFRRGEAYVWSVESAADTLIKIGWND